MHLLNITINMAFMVFRDVGCSYRTASGALYQIEITPAGGFYKCATATITTTKSKGNYMKRGEILCSTNLIGKFVFISCWM